MRISLQLFIDEYTNIKNNADITRLRYVNTLAFTYDAVLSYETKQYSTDILVVLLLPIYTWL